MRKLLLLSLVIWGFAFNAFAQLEVKKDSFKEVPGFVNINIDKMYDDNDKPYAVLKIKTENIDSKQRRELNFGGDAQTYYEVEYKEGEVWLYISYYATFIKIYHEELSSAEFYFPFDMQPKKGYELTLVNKAVPVSSGWASLTIQTKPENGAKILLNGRDLNATTPYTNNMLAAGSYEITVSKNKFETITQTVDIQDGDNKIVEIEMPYQYGLYVDGVIDGVFSVSPDKKVKFSQGNLQYQASTKTWRFAENQWDYIGDANKNTSPIYSGWIDLFGWGTGNNPTKSSTSYSDYNRDIDWGINAISNGGGGSWFTFTNDEWVYVFDKRNTRSGIRYAKAMVNGVNGVILLPDNWDSVYYNLNNINQSRANCSSNRISKSEWISMLEANGAVFLPAAGLRTGSDVYGVGSYGLYWSATYSNGGNAYYVGFDDSDLNPAYSEYRFAGFSVRLITLAE